MKFSGCFKQRILLSASQDNLISSLPICIPFVFCFFFFFLFCFVFFLLSYCSDKILSTILSKSGGRGCFFLSPDFQENAFKFSPFSITLGTDLPFVGHGG